LTSLLGFNKLNIRRSIKQTESIIYNHDSNNLNNDQRPNAQDFVQAWNQRPDWRANHLRHNAKEEHETTRLISKFPQYAKRNALILKHFVCNAKTT